MQKFLLTFLFALLAIPAVSFAASDDVTLTTDVVINVTGISLTVSGSSATLASLVVNSDSFDVGLESGSSIKVASTDRRTFTLSPSSGAFTQSTDCTSSQSTLTLSGTGTITVTVTPTSSTCTVASSGGGGGGSNPPKPKVPEGGWQIFATSTPDGKLNLLFNYGDDIKYLWISDYYNGNPATQVNATSTAIEWPQPQFGVLYIRFCNGFHSCTDYIPKVITLGIATPQTPTATFSRTLRLGSTGDDVKLLQQLLNSHGILVAAAGVGSPGNETNYFGFLTEKAVQKFQAQYGVVSSGSPETTGYGLVGPMTRAKLQEIFGSIEIVTETPIETTTPTTVVGGFSRTLRFGSTGDDVMKLQQFLNSDPATNLADTGAGSPGNETEYFGAITENAVQRFQSKYDIVSAGTPQTTGYGLVGPKTRTKLNELSNR